MNWRVNLIQRATRVIDGISFYPKLRKFYLKHLSEGEPVIFDVGSNKGQSIDFFLAINKNCKIIGFEPNRELFLNLQEKYKEQKNITIHNLGVSNKKGTLLFNENIMNETSTFEELNYDSQYLKKKAKVLGVDPEDLVVKSYEVEVVDLYSFIKENKISNIDLIKIDVEGHEYQCLQGLFSTKSDQVLIKFLQLESHYDDMYKDKTKESTIESFIGEFGFKGVCRVKNSLADYEEVIYQYSK